MIKKYLNFLSERIHTKKEANLTLELIQREISKKATLIGGFGKGKSESEHDIDILIPDIEFSGNLKNKLSKILKAESVEDTDWGGWYFNKTIFGDVDIFPTTAEFDY